MLIDIRQPIPLTHISLSTLPLHSSTIGRNIHTLRTPRDLPPLLQTVNLALPTRLGLALHEIVIVGLTPRADEVGRAQQWSRGRADLLDLGDRGRERRRVDERFAGEPVHVGGQWVIW